MQIRYNFFKIKLKGSITIYTVLTFTILMSLLFSLIHSSIFSASKAGADIACKLGIESGFAGYNNYIFNRYGIYCLSDTRAYSRMKSVIQENTSDVSSLKFDKVDITGIAYMTDKKGGLFYKEVLDYMKINGLVDAANILKENGFEQFISDEKQADNKLGDLAQINKKAKDLGELTEKENSEELLRGIEDFKTEMSKSEYSLEEMKGLKKDIEEKNFNNIDNTSNTENERSISNDEYKNLKNKLSLGLSNLVLKSEDISDKGIAQNNWESNINLLNNPIKEGGFLSDIRVNISPVNNMIFNQYILNKFSNYTSKHKDNNENILRKEDCLSYQTEYIIAGKNTDKENIDSVIGKISLYREGLNFIYLMTDPKKRQEASILAAGLFGWLGPAGVFAGEYAILSMWAYAESISDIKALMYGMKVPTIKTSSSWKVSMSDLLSLNVEPEKSKCGNGLEYSDYLRLLLITANREETAMRAMDIIELNTICSGNNAFRMKTSVFGQECEAVFKLPYGGREYTHKFDFIYSDK